MFITSATARCAYTIGEGVAVNEPDEHIKQQSVSLDTILDMVIADPPREGEDERSYNKRMEARLRALRSQQTSE
jgi:hypothetical protein